MIDQKTILKLRLDIVDDIIGKITHQAEGVVSAHSIGRADVSPAYSNIISKRWTKLRASTRPRPRE